MRARYKTDELNAARRRMARMPVGAELVDNPVSPPPGFRIGNVIVMAGVPAVMQAMLDTAAKTIETGTKMTVQTIDAGAIPEGRYAEALGAIAAAHGETIIGSYPSYADGTFRNQIVVRGRDPAKVAATQAAVEAMLAAIRGEAIRWRPTRPRRGCRANGPEDHGAASAMALGSRGGRDARKAVDGGRRASRAGAPLAKQGAASGTRTTAMADGREKAFPVSWDQFHRDARALAWRLSAAGPFEAIVAVTRGGLVPAAIVARELELQGHRDGLHRLLPRLQGPGRLQGAQVDRRRRRQVGRRARSWCVDDLVDTGATAKVVREMLPKAHFATVYAKPLGRPLVDTFITEVSQDTWIYFPWDMGLAFQPPIAKDAAG